MDIQEQISRIRDILIHWRRILRITGGDLELSKTVVYYLDHIQEDDGRIRFKTMEETPGDIVMPNEAIGEEEQTIKRNNPSQAERYLGIRIAPNGQMGTEFKFRKKQAETLARNLAKIYMTRPEVTLAYQSRWLSLVGFFTSITTSTRKQCKDIQLPIYQAILPKMGYNRHIPLVIRYGPAKH